MIIQSSFCCTCCSELLPSNNVEGPINYFIIILLVISLQLETTLKTRYEQTSKCIDKSVYLIRSADRGLKGSADNGLKAGATVNTAHLFIYL